MNISTYVRTQRQVACWNVNLTHIEHLPPLLTLSLPSPICFCDSNSPFLGFPPFSEPSSALLNPTNWIFEGGVVMENSGFSWVLRLPKPTSCSFCAMRKLLSSSYPPVGVLLLWVSPLWACYNHPCYLFFLVLQILYCPLSITTFCRCWQELKKDKSWKEVFCVWSPWTKRDWYSKGAQPLHCLHCWMFFNSFIFYSPLCQKKYGCLRIVCILLNDSSLLQERGLISFAAQNALVSSHENFMEL